MHRQCSCLIVQKKLEGDGHGRLVKLFLVAGISPVAVWRWRGWSTAGARHRSIGGAAAVLSMRFVPIPQWKCLLVTDSIQVQLYQVDDTLCSTLSVQKKMQLSLLEESNNYKFS